MAVKVTGLYKAPNGMIFENPVLLLQPKLYYKGMLHLEIAIALYNEALGDYYYTLPSYYTNYGDININDLVFGTKENSYKDLIDAIERYLISKEQTANTINSNSTFEKFTP